MTRWDIDRLPWRLAWEYQVYVELMLREESKGNGSGSGPPKGGPRM